MISKSITIILLLRLLIYKHNDECDISVVYKEKNP